MKTPEKVPCASNLRDWFAGQALIGICAQRKDWGLGMDASFAKIAFAIADHMLKAREKK
jgi:hypothetical protein